jgi:hypothetical protein
LLLPPSLLLPGPAAALLLLLLLLLAAPDAPVTSTDAAGAAACALGRTTSPPVSPAALLHNLLLRSLVLKQPLVRDASSRSGCAGRVLWRCRRSRVRPALLLACLRCTSWLLLRGAAAC